MAYQRRVPWENRSISPGKFASSSFMLWCLFKCRNPSGICQSSSNGILPRQCPHCARKVGSCFWSGRFGWCITSFASMTMGSIGERSGRWFHSLIFFRHVDTDMVKMHLSPLKFREFVHAKWRHIWNTCSNPSFLVSMSMSIFWGCIPRIFQHTPWSNRCNSLWRNFFYLEVWGWSTGVCSRSMSEFYRIYVFEWMFWNTWGQQHFSSCRRFRRLWLGRLGHLDVFFLLEVVLKIYCWEANPNFHEPWKKRQGDQGANQVLVDQVWDWTSCEITWFHSLMAVGGRRVGAGEATPILTHSLSQWPTWINFWGFHIFNRKNKVQTFISWSEMAE